MRGPTIIWFFGAEGGGKSTLIERLLESNRARELATVKLVEERGASGTTLLFDGLDEESERFAQAGASTVARLTFPPEERQALGDHLVGSCSLWDFSDGLLTEGRPPPGYRSDLSLFITRPLPPDEPLLARSREEVARLDLAEFLSLFAIRQPSPDQDLEPTHASPVEGDEDPKDLGFDAEEVDLADELVEEWEIPDEVDQQLIERSKHGVPVYRESWNLRVHYDGAGRPARGSSAS